MLTMRFSRLRSLISVAVLSLTLLAGIFGSTEPAAARSNLEGLCEATGGSFSRDVGVTMTNDGWQFFDTSRCSFPDGGWAQCEDDACIYIPPPR